MAKKYIVRLSSKEREILEDIVKRLNGGSEKVKRANILLKVDADGPNWIDSKIAEAFCCRTRTVQNLRKSFVLEGFENSFIRKQRTTPPREKKLDGAQEAEIIALRLGRPPKGFTNWSLRLLTNRVIELGISDSVSYETIRRTFKKTE